MIARKERHPSTFDLDVFFARGNCEDEGVEAHLEGCDRCRRYVEELERWTVEKAMPDSKRSLVESGWFGMLIRRFARAMRWRLD
jgi:hypothetical protein